MKPSNVYFLGEWEKVLLASGKLMDLNNLTQKPGKKILKKKEG